MFAEVGFRGNPNKMKLNDLPKKKVLTENSVVMREVGNIHKKCV